MWFKAYVAAAKAIIAVGTTRDAARREIREVVGKLGDEPGRTLVNDDKLPYSGLANAGGTEVPGYQERSAP